LVIEAEGGHDWQCVEPFAARVGGQAVEESVVACARSELEQVLRVCGMKCTLHRTSSVAEVVRMMLCKRGDLGRGNGGVAETQVSPGGACGAIGGSKGAQTWRGSLQSGFSACAGGNEGRCAKVENYSLSNLNLKAKSQIQGYFKGCNLHVITKENLVICNLPPYFACPGTINSSDTNGSAQVGEMMFQVLSVSIINRFSRLLKKCMRQRGLQM
jgi:hypothetical protein